MGKNVIFMIWYVLLFILPFFVAKLGDKRKIGYGWSLFFSFFFSIIGGLIIVLSSPMRESKFKENKFMLKALPASCLLAASLLIWKTIEGWNLSYIYFDIPLTIGFIGAFFYTSKREQ